MKTTAALAVLLAAAPAGAEKLKTLHEKTLYAVGLDLAAHAGDYALKPEEIPYVLMGMEDGLRDRREPGDAWDNADFKNRIELLQRERRAERYVKFLASAAKEPGAKRYPSGLIYKEIKKGVGENPKATDRVQAHYHGTLIDGTVFDSSVNRGQPFVSPLNRVIPCWTEGMQLMKPGGKARLICPAEIAYGDRGAPPVIPGGATLVFDVELLAVNP